MKIRIVQLNPIVGDIKGNTDKIKRAYKEASAAEVDFVIFPELSTCGYPPMDLLERSDFIERVEDACQTLIAETGQTAILFGTPLRNTNGKGRPVYNGAITARNGKEVHRARKTLLPTYDVFDEFRYFEPETTSRLCELDGFRFGITICEDIWNNENEVVYHVYDRNPARELTEQGAEVLINISASPFTQKKPELRLRMLVNHVRDLGIPLLYANQAGANTEIIFDGDSMALNAHAQPVARAPLFEETFVDVLLNRTNSGVEVTGDSPVAVVPGKEERLFKALVCGLRDYLTKTGISEDVVLGLSGGIDSALTAVIAAEALGSNHVLGITMPSEFSSAGSVTDSEKLAANLGIKLQEIAIKPAFDTFTDMLEPMFRGTEFGVAEENIQSRSRGIVLMAVSNKFGHILLNTGNKSELAVGYCTLYGDMAGGLSVISDLYKTEVFALCRWLNDVWYKRELIPREIITKPPSAELRPDQKDSDSLPEYDMLDAILYKYIELQMGRDQIAEELGDRETVNRIISMVDLNEYKRRQAPPGLRVSSKAFGSGRRLPIVQGWTRQR